MSLSIAPPSFSPYYVGLIFVIVSQALTVPLCFVTYKCKGSPAVLCACAVTVALAGLYAPPMVADVVIARSIGTASDCLVGRFLGATTYAFVALRMFGAAAGATPKGADADAATWITFATGGLDITFDDDGRPIRPPSGAVATRVAWLLLRMLALSVWSSASEPASGYPFTALLTPDSSQEGKLLAMTLDHVVIHLVLIWLFLSFAFDFAAVLLLAQGFQPIEGFDNPVFTSTSARIFWGKRWNLQVTTSFKRCVFTPLQRIGLPPTLAALITFISSGLFHEYQFLLSFPTYTLGRISIFFVLHGLLCAADALFSKAFGKKHLATMPWQLKAACIPLLYSPTMPLFSSIWIEEGFFTLISRLGFLFTFK